MSGRVRILLVDDHATVRQGLKRLLDDQSDMIVVGEAGDGAAALEQAKSLRPDVVILDLSMPGMSGLVAARRLKEAHPGMALVVLTRHAEDAYLEELLRAGASGYVLKQSPSVELLQAVRVAAAGGQYLDLAMTQRVTSGLLRNQGATSGRARAALSRRESDVLRLVAVGYSNKEIASQLSLSVKTIEVHKAAATRKLGLKGRVDIIRYAGLQGWLHDT